MIDLAPQDALSQGDIVAGFSAHDYEECDTFGLVLTARCDLQHEKLTMLNYIPVVPLREWYAREGWRKLAERNANGSRKRLVTMIAQAFTVDPPTVEQIGITLDAYDANQTQQWIEVEGGKSSDAIKKALAQWHEVRAALHSDQRCQFPSKEVRGLLKEIQEHKVSDLYYLPLPFMADSEIDCAYVALLRRIYACPMSALRRTTGVAAIEHLGDTSVAAAPLCRSKSLNFGRVGRVQSPYTEHILQRATLLFSRVGVTDIRFADINRLSETIK